MRRALSSRVGALAAAPAGARTMYVFSEQSPLLQANQEAIKSPYNIWVEDWEIQRLDLKFVKEGAKGTSLLLEKQLELFNLDQFSNAPSLLEMPRHASFATRKPYGDKLQFDMNDRAAKNGFVSKYWLTRMSAAKENLQMAPNARSQTFIVKGNVLLHNLAAFSNGAEAALYPVSGASRKLYAKTGAPFAALSSHVKSNGYRTGLYFSRRHVEGLGLSAKADAVPLALAPMVSDQFKFYNVDQLEFPQVALESLGRSTAPAPTFLISGEAIRATLPATASRFESNFWLSSRDAELYSWAIKPREVPNHTSLSSSVHTIDMFNAEQLTDPVLAFTKAGLFVSS